MKKKTFIVQLLNSKKPSRTSFTQVEDALFYSNDTDAHLVFLPHEQEGFEFNEATVALYNTDDESLVERPAVIDTFEGRKSVVLKMTEDLLAHWGRWQAQVVFKQGDKINTSVVVKFDTLRYMLDQRPPTLRDVIKVDELYSQLVTVMDEIADKDVISAPEIILARGGENTLSERLDKEHNEVTAQLAQTNVHTEGWVNVKSFGAKGDGVNDDTLAIQTALDTKKSVLIPAGNYLLTDTLRYYSRQEIYGTGDNSNLRSNIVGKAVLTNAEPCFNTNFHDFKIQGQGTEVNGVEMLDGYEHFYMDKISIVSVGGNGLHLENTYGLHANGLHIIGLGETEKGIYAYGANGCKFSDMLVKSCTEAGVHIEWSYKNTIKDSIIEAHLGNGIYSKGSNVLTLRDLYFEGNGQANGESRYDIHIDDGGELTDTKGIHYRLLIADNYFFSQNTVSTIRVSSRVYNGTIENNYILEGVAKQPYQLYRYDLDVRNSGRLIVRDIEENSRTLNGQGTFIAVEDNDSLKNSEYEDAVRLVYSADGSVISGDIPCDKFIRATRIGHMTNFTFEFANIDASTLPDNLTVYVVPPVQRSNRTGYFTAPFDFSGSSPEVLGVYGYMGGAGSILSAQGIQLKKVGTPTNQSTRFDTSNLKDGIVKIRGSFLYY